MKAIMVNEDQGFGGNMSGMDSKKNRHDWTSMDNRMEEAKLWEFANSIMSMLGGGGGGLKEPSGLAVQGGAQALTSFQQMVSDGTGGAYGVTIGSEYGQVSLFQANPNVKMTSAQQAFYELMLEVTDESKPLVVLGLLDGKNSDKIAIADYETGIIDMADVKAIGNTCSYLNMFSVLAHEVAEQTAKQRNDLPPFYKRDHAIASKVESRITGAIRIPEEEMSGELKNGKHIPAPSTPFSQMKINFLVGNHFTTTKILFLNNQVVGVSIPLVPKSN